MARKKRDAAPPESSQEARGELEMGMDTPTAQETSEGAGNGQIIGPVDESELMGCQEDAAVLQEGLLTEYAVTAEGGLNLRAGPGLDAGIIAVLPCGAGVYGRLALCAHRAAGGLDDGRASGPAPAAGAGSRRCMSRASPSFWPTAS